MLAGVLQHAHDAGFICRALRPIVGVRGLFSQVRFPCAESRMGPSVQACVRARCSWQQGQASFHVRAFSPTVQLRPSYGACRVEDC